MLGNFIKFFSVIFIASGVGATEAIQIEKALSFCWAGKSSSYEGPLRKLFHRIYADTVHVSASTKYDGQKEVLIYISDGILAGKHLYFRQLGALVQLSYDDLETGLMNRWTSVSRAPSLTQKGEILVGDAKLIFHNEDWQQSLSLDISKVDGCLADSLNSSLVGVAADSDIFAGPPQLVDHWDSGYLSIINIKGYEFYRKLNLEPYKANGGFGTVRDVKRGQFGPIHVFCDTFPEPVCELSWSNQTGNELVAKSTGKDICIDSFEASSDSLAVTCSQSELRVTRRTK